jgi:DNA repair ATPase RecN
MSDLEKEKLDILEKKIDQLEIEVKTTLNEKLKEVADDCDDLYNQITEIRNTIQEMYGEILESGRFQANQLLRMSERLENMAKDIYKNSKHEVPSIEVNVNPEINSNMNNTVNSKENEEFKEELKEDEDKPFDIKKLSLKEMIFYISCALIGVLVVIGGVVISLYKFIPMLLNLLN